MLYADSTLLIISRGRSLYLSSDNGSSWARVFALSTKTMSAFGTVSRLSGRLLRAGFHLVTPISPRSFLAFADRSIMVIDVNSGTLKAHNPLPSGRRPLNCGVTPSGAIMFGDYVRNQDRQPVYIRGSFDQGASWKILHEFRRVRHVHGVFVDPFSDSIWVTTGDEGDECAIWVTHDLFGTVEPVVQGGQQARAIPLLFSPEAVYFASDSPREQNHIYRLPRNTGVPTKLCPIDGPAFHGVSASDMFFFSSACEPTQDPPSRRVSLWGSLDGAEWHRMASFEKDGFPMRLFQYGQVRFPSGRGSATHLWFTPYAVKPDQVSFGVPFSMIETLLNRARAEGSLGAALPEIDLGL